MLFYLSYVSILRLPSEALPAFRAPPRDLLLNRTRLARQSALALRSIPNGGQMLALNLRKGKHVRGGAVLHRPCFCESDTRASSGIAPYSHFLANIEGFRPTGRTAHPFSVETEHQQEP